MRGECRPQASILSDERRPGRVPASRVGRRRRVRSDDRRRVRSGSSRDLPEGSLCLVAHPCDLLGVLADEPGPEWERYLWQRTIGDIFIGKGVLMHACPHVAWVNADDGYVARFEFCCKCFRGEVEGSLA